MSLAERSELAGRGLGQLHDYHLALLLRNLALLFRPDKHAEEVDVHRLAGLVVAVGFLQVTQILLDRDVLAVDGLVVIGGGKELLGLLVARVLRLQAGAQNPAIVPRDDLDAAAGAEAVVADVASALLSLDALDGHRQADDGLDVEGVLLLSVDRGELRRGAGGANGGRLGDGGDSGLSNFRGGGRNSGGFGGHGVNFLIGFERGQGLGLGLDCVFECHFGFLSGLKSRLPGGSSQLLRGK